MAICTTTICLISTVSVACPFNEWRKGLVWFLLLPQRFLLLVKCHPSSITNMYLLAIYSVAALSHDRKGYMQ